MLRAQAAVLEKVQTADELCKRGFCSFSCKKRLGCTQNSILCLGWGCMHQRWDCKRGFGSISNKTGRCASLGCCPSVGDFQSAGTECCPFFASIIGRQRMENRHPGGPGAPPGSFRELWNAPKGVRAVRGPFSSGPGTSRGAPKTVLGRSREARGQPEDAPETVRERFRTLPGPFRDGFGTPGAGPGPLRT